MLAWVIYLSTAVVCVCATFGVLYVSEHANYRALVVFKYRTTVCLYAELMTSKSTEVHRTEMER